MILIDQPYVSDYLIQTIRNNNFKLVSSFRSSFESLLKSLGEKAGIKNFPAHVELRVDASGRGQRFQYCCPL